MNVNHDRRAFRARRRAMDRGVAGRAWVSPDSERRFDNPREVENFHGRRELRFDVRRPDPRPVGAPRLRAGKLKVECAVGADGNAFSRGILNGLRLCDERRRARR